MERKNLSEYSIGIDMGTNSIGWSIVEEKDGKPEKFIDCGSRIFIRSVEDKAPIPKNKKRRDSRLLRRVIERRHRRKMRLRNYLISKGFLPESLKGELNPEVELNKLGNPYELRAKALDNELTPYEFGRAILHLGTRRGFLSNRKTGFGDLKDNPDDPEAKVILDEIEIIEIKEAESKKKKTSNEKEKEEKKVKHGIKEFKDDMNKAGMRTPGEYLETLPRKRNKGKYCYDRCIDRQMYQDELNLIFQKQTELNSSVYPPELKDKIEKIIFFQRSIKWDKGQIGNCSLEPNKRRINIGRLEFQQFRYWHDINNLSWVDVDTGEIKKPTLEQKKLMAEILERNEKLTKNEKKLTWAALKKRALLNLNKKTKFNLEEIEGKKGIKGNTTVGGIREIIGDEWDSFSDDKQKQLVEDLISYESKIALKKRLQDHWEFDLEKSVKLAVLELENGYGNLSLKAIKKILPYLKKGRIYSKESDSNGEKGAVQLAGYEDITKPKSAEDDNLGEIPFIPNPIVQKAIHELRRVVNAIIKQYGKPAAIRIEMARDLEENTKRYKKTQKKNRKANEEAKEKYDEIREKEPHLHLREHITYEDKLKYRLWKESRQVCSYSGKLINFTDLWSADVEIDHILPYSKTLDNSYMNKVVCFAEKNRQKGNRTPWEAFGGQTDQWNTIKGIIEHDSYPEKKRKNILTEEIGNIDGFINSQLSDTRYIAKETGKYVRSLGCDVTFTKGEITSQLRHQWGLNNILGDTGEKNRSDHRHHAIDATVIALTNRSLYQKMAQQGDGSKVLQVLDNFRDELQERVDNMIVSHSTNRKLTGAFHEGTVYGVRKENGRKGIVVRKNLTDISEPDFRKGNIICPVIREGFESYVNMNGGLKTAKQKLIDKPFKHPKTGDEVRRARVWVTKVDIKKFDEKSYWQRRDGNDSKILGTIIYGNNHHVEIIKNKKTDKFKGIVVTTMEAARRVRITKEPIVQTKHGEDWKFIMSLCINDMVSAEETGKRNLYRVRKIDRGSNGECIKLLLRMHTDGTIDKEFKKLPVSQKKKLELAKAPSRLMSDHKLEKASVNAIGQCLNFSALQ